MTIVNEARSALQSGASTVLSTIQRRPKTKRRLMALRPQKLMKQVNRRFGPRRTRKVPVLPIVLAASATTTALVGFFVLRRYRTTRGASEEFVENEAAVLVS